MMHLGKTGTNTDCIRKETFSFITLSIFPVQETPWNSNLTLDLSLEFQCCPTYRCLSSLLALCCKAAFVHSCHKSKHILRSFVRIFQYCWHELSSHISYGLPVSALQQLQMAGCVSRVEAEHKAQDKEIRKCSMLGDSWRSKQDGCCSLHGNSAAHLTDECLSLSIARWV